MTKKSIQKFKHLENEKSFQEEIQRIFHHFKGLSLKQINQTFLKGESLTLILNLKTALGTIHQTSAVIPIETKKIAVIIFNSQYKILLKPKVGYPEWIYPTFPRTAEKKIKQVSVSESMLLQKMIMR